MHIRAIRNVYNASFGIFFLPLAVVYIFFKSNSIFSILQLAKYHSIASPHNHSCLVSVCELRQFEKKICNIREIDTVSANVWKLLATVVIIWTISNQIRANWISSVGAYNAHVEYPLDISNIVKMYWATRTICMCMIYRAFFQIFRYTLSPLAPNEHSKLKTKLIFAIAEIWEYQSTGKKSTRNGWTHNQTHLQLQ